MSISTIYRAASRLLEAVNLEWDTVLGDRMQWLFALSVYNRNGHFFTGWVSLKGCDPL